LAINQWRKENAEVEMQYNAYKARNILLWIAKKLERPAIPVIWAIIYLTERKHIAELGTWMLEDTFVAMRHGPVPLRTFAELHQQVGSVVTAKERLPMEAWLKSSAIAMNPDDANLPLTPFEKRCLEQALWEAGRLGFADLERQVRGVAWRLAGPDGFLDPLEVAREGGATEATLDYIMRWREPPYLLEVGQGAIRC
jgi:Protein of unknown function (DUF4065)